MKIQAPFVACTDCDGPFCERCCGTGRIYFEKPDWPERLRRWWNNLPLHARIDMIVGGVAAGGLAIVLLLSWFLGGL
jgi:hypothetical protein